MALRFYYGSSRGHILHEDLTGIVSDAVDIRVKYQKELVRICEGKRGLGLAANQVGLRENFFFVRDKTRLQGKVAHHLCVNPTWATDPKGPPPTEMLEGCLSYPDRAFMVKRYPCIIASWKNAVGHQISDARLKGKAAHVFQHEYDHLLGKTIDQYGTEVE